MNDQEDKAKKRPCIYSEKNIVYNINNEFLDLTGYEDSDIIEKSLEELSILLRSDSQISFESIKEKENIYIFDREDSPIDVLVTCKNLIDEDKRIYYIEEDLNSPLKGLLYNFNSINISEKQSVAIYSYLDCLYLKSNEKYLKNLELVGMDTEDIIGKIPHLPKKVSDIIKSDSSFHETEIEVIRKDGKKTYWDINGSVVFGKEDKKCLVVFFYDVTEKVLERKSYEKQRIGMKEILNNISDTINIVNKKGKYIYVNKSGVDKLAPYTSDIETMDDKKAFDSFQCNDIEGNELSYEDTPVQRVLRGETIVDYIIVGASDLPTTYHLCNGSPTYDKFGDVDGGILIYEDIGDSIKKDEYHAFKENIKELSQGYAILSPNDFKVKYINDVGLSSFKKHNSNIASELEIIGKNFFDFYQHEESKLSEIIRNTIKGKIPYYSKQKLIEDGKVKYVKTIFKPIFNEQNKIEEITAMGIDITDEELAREEMADNLAMQDDIFINTSHELKTPLNVIFSAAQLLEVYLESECIEDIRENVIDSNKIIIKNCYRLTKLINNISDISKLESGFYKLNLSNHDIVKVIEDIIYSVSEYIKFSGLSIVFQNEIEEMLIAFDPYKFERVLLNLISNSIKFSKSNGLIVVKLVESDSGIEVSVSDDGIGIDLEKQNMIFSKFVQLDTSLNRLSEGTGIGLALSKSIVELHGGSIRVESIIDEGSTFIVEFPLRTIPPIFIANKETKLDGNYNMDKYEMIKYELSDIY